MLLYYSYFAYISSSYGTNIYSFEDIYHYLKTFFIIILEETVNERIKIIIKHFDLNPNSFSVKMGMRDTTIRNIISGRNKPSYDVMIKILSTFEDISPLWLLDGSGQMLIKDLQADMAYLTEGEDELPRGNLRVELGEEDVIYGETTIKLEIKIKGNKVVSVNNVEVKKK